VTTGISIDADGSGNSISNIENADIKAGAAIDATKIANGNVSNTEFQYLDGVTSAIQTQLNDTNSAISNHISDTSAAHAASAVSNTPSGNLAATDVQAALNELQGDVDNNGSAISNHISDTTDAHDASAISNVPAGNLVATDVQGALNELQTDINGRQLTSEKGNANGYASLDGGGKVPVAQLPATLMTYEGTWDAATNTPTLANGTGDAGMVYIVNGAGTVNFGAGNITFAIGDWVIYNGTIWQKSDNADDVMSVNGFTGVVTLDYDDVNAVEKLGTVVDNRLVRTDGVTGDQLQQTGITISDTDAVTGVAELTVDNLNIDGNTVSSTAGNIELNANSGIVGVTSDIRLRSGSQLIFQDDDNSQSVIVSIPSNVTTNRTPEIPDATGNFVLTSATQALTAKDIDGGTASNTSRITIPKNTKANLDALTRKEATLVYASDLDQLYVDDGSTLVEVGSGSSSGDVTFFYDDLEDGSASNWTGYADAAAATPVDGTGGTATTLTVTASSSSPLRGGFSLSVAKSAANGQGQGIATSVAIPSGYAQSAKRTIEFLWDGSGANYVAGDMACYIYDVTNATLITPSVAALPAYKTPIQISWDASTSVSYRLIFHVATTNANAYTVKLDDIAVGPGQIVPVPAVGNWINYTPIISGLGTGNASITYATYKQNTDSMQIRAYLTINSPTGSDAIGLSLPTGYTTSAYAEGATNLLGGGMFYDSSVPQRYPLAPKTTGSGSSILYFEYMSGGANSALTVGNVANGDVILIDLEVKIAQWAGAPNYAGQNDVEFLSNSSTSASDDSTTFAYGQAGSQLPNGTAAGLFYKRVRRATPKQAGDLTLVEVTLDNGVTWSPAGLGGITSGGAALATLDFDADTGFGFIREVNSTDIDVAFLRYRSGTSAWSSMSTSSTRWRVRIVKSGAAVGFGAATATRLGLVKGGAVPGEASGATIATGNIGEKLESAGSTSTAATTNIASITLTAGVWLVQAKVTGNMSSTAAGDYVDFAVSSANNNLTGAVSVSGISLGISKGQFVTGTPSRGMGMASFHISVGSNTTYYLNTSFSGTGTISGHLLAVRAG
jgi:hypothetical protein